MDHGSAIINAAWGDGYRVSSLGGMPTKEKTAAMFAQLSAEDKADLLKQLSKKAPK
jgi:hypothetical protein